MHLIHSKEYYFEEDKDIQMCHLRDVGHMPKVHKISLWGASLGKVKRLDKNTIGFKLKRFGNISDFTLTYNEEGARVSNGNFALDFYIHELEQGHILRVRFYSINKYLIYFRLIIDLLFWLTIQEDKKYFMVTAEGVKA